MTNRASSWISIIVIGFFAGLGGSACNGGSNDGEGGSTGSATTSTGAGGSDACTPIANIADVVHKDHDPGPPPAMTGGTIVDGTYVLTKMVQYNGENGDTAHQETLELAGGNGRLTGIDQSVFFTYTTSGNQITLTLTCGATGTMTTTYTATATEFTMVNPDDPNEVHTSTKM